MIFKRYFFLFFLLILVLSCATTFKGYNDKVYIINPPEDLIIQTIDGVNIPCLCDSAVVHRMANRKTERYVTKDYYINLRSNQQHTLRLKSATFDRTIVVYPKIGGSWLVLDTITGILPIFIDMYTGCFNHFDDIEVDVQ